MTLYVIGTAFGDVRCTCGFDPWVNRDDFVGWPQHQEMHRAAGDECLYPWEVEK